VEAVEEGGKTERRKCRIPTEWKGSKLHPVKRLSTPDWSYDVYLPTYLPRFRQDRPLGALCWQKQWQMSQIPERNAGQRKGHRCDGMWGRQPTHPEELHMESTIYPVGSKTSRRKQKRQAAGCSGGSHHCSFYPDIQEKARHQPGHPRLPMFSAFCFSYGKVVKEGRSRGNNA